MCLKKTKKEIRYNREMVKKPLIIRIGDRILDMCRTVVNVTGDATVASVVSSLEE